MDSILQKYAGKITTKSVVKTVEELRVEYIDDGLQRKIFHQSSPASSLKSPNLKDSLVPRRRNSSSPSSITSSNKLMQGTRIVILKLF